MIDVDSFGETKTTILRRIVVETVKEDIIVDIPDPQFVQINGVLMLDDKSKQKLLEMTWDAIKTKYPIEYPKIQNMWFERIRGIIETSGELKQLVKNYVDMRHLAQQFLEIQPLFYDNSKIWWMWDKNKYRWDVVDEVDILNSVWFIVQNINTVNSKIKTEIIEALKQESRLKRPKEISKSCVQFRGKLVDIKTDIFDFATPDKFVTNPIPWDLGDSDDTPIMDDFIVQWFGEEYKETAYEILAYCCLMDYPIHRIFCFVGSGCNGKSQFLKVLRKFIGVENCCSTELDVLTKSRFESARLHKKLVCQMGETNYSEIDETSILKKLCGGDLIGYEYKNKDPFQDVNYAKIIIATNSLPTTKDKTNGFYRRWLIIDFKNRFAENNGDIFEKIPDEEYKNLARKCISILKKLNLSNSFTKEGTIEERTKKYEEKSNPFEKFWSERVKEDFEGYIYKYLFKQEFDDWCKNYGFRKMSEQEIKHKMNDKNIDEGKKSFYSENNEAKQYRAWLGISLLKSNEYPGYPGYPPSYTPPPHRGIEVNRVDKVDMVTIEPNLMTIENNLSTIKNDLSTTNTSIGNEGKAIILNKKLEEGGYGDFSTLKNFQKYKYLDFSDILEILPNGKNVNIQQVFEGLKFIKNIEKDLDLFEKEFDEIIEKMLKEGLIITSKPGEILKI